MGWQISIERRIATGRCVACGAAGLRVVLRCETTHRECAGTVTCEACGAAFALRPGRESRGDPQASFHAWIHQLLLSADGTPLTGG